MGFIVLFKLTLTTNSKKGNDKQITSIKGQTKMIKNQ